MLQSALWAALPLVFATAAPESGEAAAATHRTDWMAHGTYGLMVHYLIAPQGDTPEARTASFNQTVGAFDLDGFMAQFDATGADWLIFTIGQNTNYYCSPNAFLDGIAPGHTSRRDLVLEIARAVDARGKRLIVYLPAEVSALSPELRELFGWGPPDHARFEEQYLQFVRAYAEKLGDLCDGWWLDGCYPGAPVHAERYDWAAWAAACRAGNPDCLVAFSDASYCVGRLRPVTPLQDYMGGEVHLLEDGKIRTDFVGGESYFDSVGRLRMRGQEAVTYYMPGSRFVDGVQWHALVPIDSTFNPAVPVEACTYADEEMFSFVDACKSVGGAVTLNAPIDTTTGRIPNATASRLARLAERLSR